MEKIPFKKWLPFLVVMIALFYVVPPLILGTRLEDFSIKIITPAFCLGGGIIFGKINGWVWYFCAIVALVFAPSLVFYYAQSDIHYIFEYGGLALLGNLLGYAFHRDKY